MKTIIAIGPTVRKDQGLAVFATSFNILELDFDAIYLGNVLRIFIERRFLFSPVIIGCPVSDEFFKIGFTGTKCPV